MYDAGYFETERSPAGEGTALAGGNGAAGRAELDIPEERSQAPSDKKPSGRFGRRKRRQSRRAG